MEIPQAVHGIWYSQDLTSMACCHLDLWPPDSNQIIKKLGASEYSLSVISKLFMAFMRYRGNNICQDKRSNEQLYNGTTRKHNA